MSRVSSVTTEQSDQANEMRLMGLSYAKIADRLGLTFVQVRWATTPVEARRERYRKRKLRLAQPDRSPNHFGLFAVHEPRPVRRILASSDCIIGAARAFAAGEISRTELMMRISP